MALMDELRDTLTSIGNSIRNKTGSSDALTMDGMVEAINGISTGGSGGGSSGGGSSSSSTIANGYTVNFHNAEDILIQSHSAIYGYKVDKPISYVPGSWVDDSGNVCEFPLTVTEDSGITAITLHASDDPNVTMCADVLYEAFGVNKEEYPLLCISTRLDGFDNAYVWFCGSGKNTVYNMTMGFMPYDGTGTVAVTHYFDDLRPPLSSETDNSNEGVLTFTNWILSNMDKIVMGSPSTSSNIPVGTVGDEYSWAVYTNFWWEDPFIDGYLHEVPYVEPAPPVTMCSDMLYSVWPSIDKSTYPYVTVWYDSGYLTLVFNNSLYNGETRGVRIIRTNIPYTGVTDPLSITQYIVTTGSENLGGVGTNDTLSLSNHELLYTNWHNTTDNNTHLTIDARLDATPYVAPAPTCAEKLYDYYGYSADDYPFIFIIQTTGSAGNTIRLIFASSYSRTDDEEVYYNITGVCNTIGISSYKKVSSATSLVNAAIAAVKKSNLSAVSNRKYRFGSTTDTYNVGYTPAGFSANLNGNSYDLSNKYKG